jgi:hypothetical protein
MKKSDYIFAPISPILYDIWTELIKEHGLERLNDFTFFKKTMKSLKGWENHPYDYFHPYFNAFLINQSNEVLDRFGIPKDGIIKPVEEVPQGAITTPDPERLNLANQIDTRIANRAKAFLLLTLVDLRQIYDTELFIELGCQSLNEYLCVRLNMDSGSAAKYVRIIEHLMPFLKLDMSSFPNNLLSDNNLESGMNVGMPRNLPTDMHKLYALSKLKPEWKTDLFEKGKVRLRGKWITLEDFCRLSRQQVIDIVDACMNSRKTPEEKAAIVLPWTKYREVVFTKIDRFQSTLFDIQRSPSMPPEVLADFNTMLDGVNEFWDKYFPNGRESVQAEEK